MTLILDRRNDRRVSTPPPPPFGWSPSPASFHFAGADKRFRSRDATAPESCNVIGKKHRRFRSSSDFAGGGGRFVTIAAAHE
jgi:hypothetical protein